MPNHAIFIYIFYQLQFISVLTLFAFLKLIIQKSDYICSCQDSQWNCNTLFNSVSATFLPDLDYLRFWGLIVYSITQSKYFYCLFVLHNIKLDDQSMSTYSAQFYSCISPHIIILGGDETEETC